MMGNTVAFFVHNKPNGVRLPLTLAPILSVDGLVVVSLLIDSSAASLAGRIPL